MYKIILNIIWALVTALIILVGIYFTKSLGFIQFKFRDIFSSFKRDDNSSVSVFEALSLSLGAKIGIGSLSGIALAIYLGGAGTIFWVWVISLLSASICFAESVLGSVYKEKALDSYRGGASYYIKKGLNMKKISIIYAIFIILAYIGGFLPIQVNTMIKSVKYTINFKEIALLLIIIFLYIIIIFGRKNKLYKFISFFVPIMGIFYIGIGLIIIIKNFNNVESIFEIIMGSAFNFRSILSGFFYTMIVGIQRGIFSNEAGVGTSAISSGISSSNPIKQGFAQMSGVYITSLIVCTITAFIILLSPYQDLDFNNFNGIELTSYAFNYHFGTIGKYLLMIVTLLFAFSTVISGYYFGESSLLYIFPNIKKRGIFVFKLGSIFFLILGYISSANFIWNSVDLVIGLLSVINISSVYLLRNDVLLEYKYYKKRKS